ncbi:MAG: AIR synthase-related protein, partial [Thermoanaerobacterales bacterium]|nr:AIR synthase-related protein [Thermoanaerobacterales bacterium]
ILTRLLVNDTVQHVVREKPRTLLLTGEALPARVVPITNMDDEALMALSRDRLFLNLDEMRLIRDHFREAGREPTDCEIEILAQTWSEHCVHKTFKASLIVDGVEKPPLLKRLQEATRRVAHPLVLSAFEDNSGVFAFYNGWAVCGKVETHNSPSAIEPYGGAATGSGGVFRDIMGTGQGAAVVASTDMFCFASPDTPAEDIPAGCLHPSYLLRRVVAGVRDYGNRMGIPTCNGSVHFHPDFRAKPTVIVGAYGLLPKARAGKGHPVPGDLVVVIGGRTGRDGLHGATFSSAAMTDRTVDVHAQAVQVGHPIEEKRTADAVLAARDEDLIRAITDCGAGGFASAVGEMASETGAEIALDAAPLKYAGLAPWEILLSESQERMVCAVAPQNWERFSAICRAFNVEATVLGRFTGDGRFRATYNGETVMDLSMDFLHCGLPQRVMQAKSPPKGAPGVAPPLPEDWADCYRRVMGHLNVCSKEPIVRVYDHGVQGSSALPPFGGLDGSGPNDACMLTPLLGRPYGLIISHGLNPVLNRLDPYWGGLWACAEAVANAVAAGADIRETALIDNFIWPVPDEETLGYLDRAVDACVDFSLATGMPFISGKDSLSSTYRGPGGTLVHIPPVLCVSAFGRVPDVRHTVSSDFKRPGISVVILIGHRRHKEMGGSVYWDIHGVTGANLPRLDLAGFVTACAALHDAITAGEVLACHDISEGGLAAALAEMCFGGRCGALVNIPEGVRPDEFLFNETAGCFLVEIRADLDPAALFKNVPWTHVGRPQEERVIEARTAAGERLFAVSVDELKAAWDRPMREVFGE